MGIRHLGGSPWHTEYASLKEKGEKRRHKRRCLHFRDSNYCKLFKEKCFGSGVCKSYNEIELEERKTLQKEENKEYEISLKNIGDEFNNSVKNKLKIGDYFRVKDRVNNTFIIFHIVGLNKEKMKTEINKEGTLVVDIKENDPIITFVSKSKIGNFINIDDEHKYILLDKNFDYKEYNKQLYQKKKKRRK